MNGVHDMGGMQGMGPIGAEPNEPVFHAPWESRVFALRRAMGAWRKWNIDATRYQVELVPPAEYLALSYYARQFVAFLVMLERHGFVTSEEIQSGKPDPARPKATPALTPEKARTLVASGVPTSRPVDSAPRFRVGERVRARDLNPTGHTRLPRYVRGRIGTIARQHGGFVFPDTNASFEGEHPQHLYSVRFDARVLWGAEAGPRDGVYLDLWEDYLEPA